MADPGEIQRREFSRVSVHLQAEVQWAGSPPVEGVMENLGLRGGFLRTTTPPGEGPCQVRLHLPGTEIQVRANGHVVRPGPGGCAIQFDELIGVSSFEHLRNLILYNAEDPGRVEQEFHDHLGLRRA